MSLEELKPQALVPKKLSEEKVLDSWSESRTEAERQSSSTGISSASLRAQTPGVELRTVSCTWLAKGPIWRGEELSDDTIQSSSLQGE